MNRLRVAFLVPFGLLALSCWLPFHRSFLVAMSAHNGQVMQEASESKETAKKMEASLSSQKANTLIVGDEQGKILKKFNTEELRRNGIATLAEFLKKNCGGECKKISTNCRKCPDGHIYCTNDKRFAGESE